MKSAEIQKSLMVWARANTSEIVVPNYFLGRFEADLLKITRAGLFTEYEIKVSRADFKKDAEKGADLYQGWQLPTVTVNKHEYIRAGKHVHRFYFVVPDGLVDPAEVPAGFGLIIAYMQINHRTQLPQIYFRIAKVSKLFPAIKCSQEQYRHIATNLCIKLASAKERAFSAEQNYRSLIKAAKTNQ